MSAIEKNTLVICNADYQRLLPLAEKQDTATAEALLYELERADIVPSTQFPSDAVCMGSRVTFVDLDTGEKTLVSLVFPEDADVEQLNISILSPVGSALIGLRIGGRIDWPLPEGKIRRIEVVSVSQPKINNQYHNA